MKKGSYVVCHMLSVVNSKIDGEYSKAPEIVICPLADIKRLGGDRIRLNYKPKNIQ